jgi:bifunctional DNase/RNase
MSEVQVVGVAIDSAGQRVIMLKPRDEPPGQGKLLPIWIGEQEATSILVAVEGLQMPRPLAHDLMRAAIDALGGRVDRVEISSIENGTFYAVVYLDGADGEHVIDARPSDAIALASRAGAPLFVAEDVLENAGIEDTITTPPGEAGELNEEHRLEEFRSFLDTVNPEDFGE